MKKYCTQNGDCSTCSLSNYGRDCRNMPIETRDERINIRVTAETKRKLNVIAKGDSRSMSNVIETLIDREYKNLEGKNMKKTYRIVTEHWDNWGASKDNCVVDIEEIERLAHEWDCSIEELMEQVEKI